MRTTTKSQPAIEVSLLDRVATGDPEAMRECVTRHGGLVWSLARRFEPEDAEEAAQEIFLDLWKSASDHDPRVASEAAFIAVVARRRLIERRRSRHSHRAASPSPASAEPLALADASSDPSSASEATTAARALTALRPEQRQVLVLAACRGLTHGQIAAETGLSLAAVKAHVRRGLLSIRAALWGVERESP